MLVSFEPQFLNSYIFNLKKEINVQLELFGAGVFGEGQRVGQSLKVEARLVSSLTPFRLWRRLSRGDSFLYVLPALSSVSLQDGAGKAHDFGMWLMLSQI